MTGKLKFATDFSMFNTKQHNKWTIYETCINQRYISQEVPSHLGEEFLGMTSDLHGSLCSYMLWEKKKNNVCKCQNFIPLNFNQHIPSENYTFSNIKKNIEQDSGARRSLFSWSILIKCNLTETLVHQLCREDSLF